MTNIDVSEDFPEGELFELSECTYGVTKKHWICGTESNEHIQLVALFELIDREEYDLLDDGEDDTYPVIVETSVMIHPKFFAQEFIERFIEPDITGDYLLYDALLDAHMYGCHIPVNPESVSGSRTCDVESEVNDTRCGEFRHFKNFDDAEKYIREIYVPNMDVIMGLCGFYLDAPMNAVGTTGWDFISEMTEGTNAFKESFDRVMNEKVEKIVRYTQEGTP
jgi:hypothetical protein